MNNNTLILVLMLVIMLLSCIRKDIYNDNEFVFSKTQNELLNLFAVNDTLQFKDEKENLYTIVISDSLIEKHNSKGKFTNKAISKSISLLYEEIGNNQFESKKIEQVLLSVSVSPEDTLHKDIYFNWDTDFAYQSSNDDIGSLLHVIDIQGKKFYNIYKLEHINFNYYFLNKIKFVYLSLEDGIIGYETGSGEIWMNVNFL
ncbi:MAG: hypothetical protein HC892_10775 [Saprospiraceae bacterium]|nr:hypothetical protein [Saprospiraceae bacterium]